MSCAVPCPAASPPPRTLTRAAATAAAALALAAGPGACAHNPGTFTWVDQLSDRDVAAGAGAYVAGPGDLLSVQVFSHPEMSGRARVRDDGRLSIPLLGDVSAAGRTPTELARDIATQLEARNLAVATRVTVLLEERAPLRVSILGEVARPGLHPLDPDAGLAQALASAGGFTEFAHRDRIYVVRRAPTPARIRFRYDALVRARGRAADFRLRPNDVIVVE
jgi:polysaccharide export outer membrane protein